MITTKKMSQGKGMKSMSTMAELGTQKSTVMTAGVKTRPVKRSLDKGAETLSSKKAKIDDTQASSEGQSLRFGRIECLG